MNKSNNFSVAASTDGHLTTNQNLCRPQISELFNLDESRELLTVKDVATIYKICQRTIYDLIKTDPSFPYINVGLKKKYMIDREKLEAWIEKRTRKERQSHFKLADSKDLIGGKNNE